MESIGEKAFYDCYKLVEVIDKSSTLTITTGSSSNGYVAYHALEVHSGDSKIVNKDGYLFYTIDGVNYLVNYIGTDTELILPANYNGANYVINERAFDRKYWITKVTISDGVTSIGKSAFRQCPRLVSVIIPDSVESIGRVAFYYCYDLTDIYINKDEGSISGSPWEAWDATIHWNSTGPDAA